MIRCVVFDLEAVLLAGAAPGLAIDVLQPQPGAAEVLQRCFSRYRLAAVSTSSRGNVVVKGALEATDWGRTIEVVVTPKEVAGPAAYRAVCSAIGTQTVDAVLVTSRPDAAHDANAAGLAVLMIGPRPEADELRRPERAVVTVDHLDWVPEALREMGSG